MEYYTTSLLLLSITVFTIIFTSRLISKSKLPPGPKPWPIIGNIHKLGDKPYKALDELSKTFGPIMSLKLGNVTTIVISSPEIAKEMFIKHDLDLSGRPIRDAGRAVDHNEFSMVWLPVGPKWRNLRKIATIQLFTNQRLDSSQDLRHIKVKELVEYIRQCCEKGMFVDIGKAGFITMLNLLSNTFFSMDLASHASSDSQEFKDLVSHILEDGARPNMSDFFPFVRKLDFQGVFERRRIYMGKLIEIFEEIIDERLKNKSTDDKDDVLCTLLKLVQTEELSLDDVKHLLVIRDLIEYKINHGTNSLNTTSITLEWAMAELLRNPEKMEKAQLEIDEVLGKDTLVQESNISRLPYIQAIIKEALRLHPPGPFLVPHKAEKDVILYNYLVPKNSSIWVNIWSIGRNANVWSNSELFSPERHLEMDIDIKGSNFKLMPFGSGRRICPGMPQAYRMTHLMLATLLQSFNWKIGNGASPKDIDMDEKFGLTLRKAQPLQSIPLSR